MNQKERENQRYEKDDHCKINFEERMMFKILNNWSRNRERASVKVLDIGCGSGLITKEIKKIGYSVEGVDFSKEAIAKAICNGIDTSICDLDEGIDKPNERYDVVWAGDIIEHVFDPIGLIKEIYRVLKKNGIVIICIPSDVGIISRIKMLFGVSYQEQMYRKSGYYKHHTFFSLNLILYMLKIAKLTPKEINKILIFNKKRYLVNILPSAFYNTLVILAKKNEKENFDCFA